MSNEEVKKDWAQVKANALLEDEELQENIADVDSDTDSKFAGLEKELILAQADVQKHLDTALRMTAELENVRRRASIDVANAHKYALEKFMQEMLSVVDSLEAGIALVDKEGNQAMHEGLDLTMQLLLGVLSKHGVVQTNPVGEIFNPELHEAMAMQESKDLPNNSVMTVFQKGYILNGRVVRPARVVVVKEKAK
jgi:molecular chaperone GrpE